TVGDLCLDDRPPAGPHRPAADLAHLREDRHVLARTEVSQVGQLAALGVPPRIVAQQVADGLQVEAVVEAFAALPTTSRSGVSSVATTRPRSATGRPGAGRGAPRPRRRGGRGPPAAPAARPVRSRPPRARA